MTSALRVACVLIVILAAGASPAAEVYVAPDGDDANPGTLDKPFTTLGRAQQAVTAGDTIWIRGGTYAFRGNDIAVGVLLEKSGAEGKRINYFAYQDEKPVFDFFKLSTPARIKGFSVTGSWLHLRGLEIRGVQQILTNVNESWAVRVESGGSNNVFERLDLHHNEGPGLFIADGGNNLVLNCDSHHNHDPDRKGENADGFGSHSDDNGNVFRGCRAWANSDDGYDFINSPGVATVEYCWAWRNGFVPDTTQRAGNGAGIKAGGFGLNRARFPARVPRHVVRFNLSFHNRAQGFYANHHPGGIDWFNNTAFANPRNFDMTADVGAAKHVLRNNLAHGPGGALSRHNPAEVDDDGNSWNGKVTVTDADFASVSPTGVDGPRQANGSLPTLDFMRLVPGSDLIDAGKDVGLPFRGKAPDLGAFETQGTR
jgi:hypothetical protein